MTTHTITIAAFDTTLASYSNGDVIEFTDSGVIDVGNAHTWSKGLTIRPAASQTLVLDANPLGAPGGEDGTFDACFTPLVTFRGIGQLITLSAGQTLTFEGGIGFDYDNSIWPDWTGAGETWISQRVAIGAASTAGILVFNSNAGDLVLDQVKIRGGYGPTGIDMPLTKVADCDSPTTYYSYTGANANLVNTYSATQSADYNTQFAVAGHGDASPRNDFGGALFNAMAFSPGGLQGATTGNVTVTRSQITDTYHGLNVALTGTGNSFVTWGNFYARTVSDNEQIAQSTDTTTQRVKSGGHIHFDPLVANGKDLGNPHGDAHQFFGAGQEPRNIEIYNCFLWTTSAARALTQFGFLKDCPSFYGPVIRNLVAVGANKAVAVYLGRDPYIRGCIGVNASYLANSDNVSASITNTNVAGTPSSGLIENCIGETSISGGSGDTLLNNSTLVRSNEASQLTAFSADLSVEPATLWDAFEALRPIDTTKGPKRANGSSYANLKAFLLDDDFTGERVWAKPANRLLQATSTVIESVPAFVHGGDKGDTLAVEMVTAGLEWRCVDIDDSATQISAYTSASGTIAVGKRIQLRATSSASNSAYDQFTYTVGGTEFSWAISTVSANVWPEATIPATTRISKATNGLTGIANTSNNFSFAVRFKPLSLGASGRILSIGNGSGALSLGVATGTPAKSAVTSQFLNAAAANVINTGFNGTTSGVQAGVEFEFFFSYDASAGTAAAGRIVYKGDGTPISTFTADVLDNTKDPRFDDVAWSLFGSVFDNNFMAGDVSYFAFWNETFDLTDELVRQKLTIDYIGPNGEGPTANGDPALIFVVGNAAALDSTTVSSNRGSGGAFVKAGATPGTITQAVSAPWPPPLNLAAELVTASPTVGQPVEILVYPLGTNKLINVTAASDQADSFDNSTLEMAVRSNGIVFTYNPTTAGDHTITFTDDSDTGGEAAYTAPAPVVVTVQAAAVTTRRTGCLSLGLRLGL